MVEILLGFVLKKAIQANEWPFYFKLGRNTIKVDGLGRYVIRVGRNTITLFLSWSVCY